MKRRAAREPGKAISDRAEKAPSLRRAILLRVAYIDGGPNVYNQ